MVKKVDATMSTEIALDMLQASNSLKSITQLVNSATNSWKAQEAQLKSTGDYLGAAKAKYEGLSDAISAQESKVEALKNKQSSLKGGTEETARAYAKYQSQIDSATSKLSSMQAQQDRAKSAMELQQSGILQLNNSIKAQTSLMEATIRKQEALGDARAASNTKIGSLTSINSKYEDVLEKEKEQLEKVKDASGNTSDAYTKQATRVENLKAKIAENNSAINNERESLEKSAPSGFFSSLKEKLVGTSEEVEKQEGLMHKATSYFIGGVLVNGFQNATNAVKGFAEQGFESAEAAQEVAEKWKNMGASEADITTMGNSVKSLKENTNLSGTAVANLTTKFYDMTGSASKTKQLAQGVGSLSDKLKLTNTQADGFANGLSKIEASGTVTSSSLGRIEKQAPGLGTALQQASGMSKTAFDSLVSSGKLTSTQFNNILQKASKDYKKNSSEFDSSSQGALKHIKQSWADTKQALMTPLVNITATGLSSLSAALEAPAMQNAIKQLGTGIANLGTKLTGVMKYVAAHESDIQSIISSVVQITKLLAIGAWDTFKVVITGISNAFNDMTGKANKTKDPLKSVASFLKDISSHKKLIEAIGTALVTAFAAKSVISGIHSIANGARALHKDFNTLKNGISMARNAMVAIKTFAATNPFTFWITAIALVVAGFVELYKHSAKFRAFVNGIVKACQDFYKGTVKWFKQTWSSLTKGASNAWKNTKKFFSDGWNGAVKLTQNGYKNTTKWFSNTWSSMKKGASDVWSNTKKTFSNGWNETKKLTQAGATWVGNNWNTLKNTTIKTAQDLWKNQKGTFKDGYSTLNSYTQTWHDIMTGKWGKVGSDIKNTTNDFIKTIKSFFTGMYDWLNKITGGRLGDVLNTFKSIFGSIKDVISGAVKGIKHAFGDIVRGILSPFNDMLSGLRKGINWVLDKVGATQIKSKWQINVPNYATGTQGGVLHDQLALVNDAKGSNYREIYREPNGQIGMFPAQRNMIVPLKAGTEILDADNSVRLAKSMGLSNYASGTIGSFFSGIFNKGKDLLEDTDKIIAHPIEFLESVFTKFTSNISSGAGLASDIITNFPATIAKNAVSWVKKLFSDNVENVKGTATPAQAKEVIEKAMSVAGVSGSNWLNGLETIAKYESGFRNVTNNWDSNAKAGHPSSGWFQMIKSTFEAYAKSGYGSWTNPLDQAISAIRYIKAEYGGIGNVPGIKSLARGGKYVGYANGGFISNEGLYHIAENNKPEAVIPLDAMKSSRAWELIGKTAAVVSSNSGSASSGLSSSSSNFELDKLMDKFESLISAVGKMSESFAKDASKPTELNIDSRIFAHTIAPAMDQEMYFRQQAANRRIAYRH
jgi:tape measure domain-containing protein